MDNRWSRSAKAASASYSWPSKLSRCAAKWRSRSSTSVQSLKRLAQIEKGVELLTSIFADLDLKAVKEGNEPLEAVLAERVIKPARSMGKKKG